MKLLAKYVEDAGIISTKEYKQLRKACIDFEQKFGVTLWTLIQTGICTPFALTHLEPKQLEAYLHWYPKQQKVKSVE